MSRWDQPPGRLHLLLRANLCPKRVLSLLLFAESIDRAVPPSAVRHLFELVHAR